MTESTGQQALRYMWSKDNPGVTVKTISEEFDVSLSAMSKALRTLEVEGLARRDHGKFGSRPEFDSSFATRSKAALVYSGGRSRKRTPDTWFATEAGIQLMDEHDAHRSMQLANEYDGPAPVCRCAEPGMTDDDMYQCPAENCVAHDYLATGGALSFYQGAGHPTNYPASSTLLNAQQDGGQSHG